MQELAGRYHFGAIRGMQQELQLLKNHRFTYILDGCQGVYAHASGTWQQKNGSLLLVPKPPYDPIKSGLNLRFIPVTWGQRLYLIDENQLPGFCAATQQKTWDLHNRYISSMDFARHEGRLLPKIQGIPQIPMVFREFLTQGEIIATVTAATANDGILLRENGPSRLKLGMRLCLNRDGNAPNVIVVSTDSAGVYVKPLPTPYRQTPIHKGDVFTTGSYRYRPEGTRFFV